MTAYRGKKEIAPDIELPGNGWTKVRVKLEFAILQPDRNAARYEDVETNQRLITDIGIVTLDIADRRFGANLAGYRPRARHRRRSRRDPMAG